MYLFKLEAFLNHRRHQEEVCQKDLAQAEKLLAEVRGELHRLKNEMRDITQKLQSPKKIHINVSVIVLSLNYLRQLSKTIEKQTEFVREATRKVDQKRTELVMIVKKRKIIEKLKEKEQLAYQRKMLQNERKLMDELASIRHARNM